MTPKITNEMRQAIREHPGEPIAVEDDQTRKQYVLIGWEQYVPTAAPAVDRPRLREAILRRRDESRRLNVEWEDADREVWDQEPDA